MNPCDFKQSNVIFAPPETLDEKQCGKIRAWTGTVKCGSVDGARIVVTAWKPTPEEIKLIQDGNPVFLSILGGLPPHFISMDFDIATQPR